MDRVIAPTAVELRGPGPRNAHCCGWPTASRGTGSGSVSTMPSDSGAGRHIAIRIWEAVFDTQTIVVPTLERALYRAAAEWRRA